MAIRPSSSVPNRHQDGHSAPKQLPTSASSRSTSVPKRVATPKVAAPPKKRFSRRAIWEILLAIALCGFAIAGLVRMGQVGLHLLLSPQSFSWVNRWIPGWITLRVTEATPKTLHDIRDALKKAGQRTGEVIPLCKGVSFLDGKSAATDLLLPVLKSQVNCQADCDRVVELRVYQTSPGSQTPQGESAYYLVNQLAVKGPEESFVVAPLVDAHSDSQGSSHALPLAHLSRFEGKVPAQGIWLNLSGRRQWGNDTIAYGQIIHYYPKHHHLAVKLQWTSPTGEAPIWKQVTGNSNPELIVNHTLGLEPQFEIYQVKPFKFISSPIQLEEVSLADPVLQNPAYRNAMLLARNGLWSTSLEELQALKQQLPKKQWTAAVQAQMDVVRWHAQVTKVQAEGSWASPGQQVMANLIDGRWQSALLAFQASAEAIQETAAILKGDPGRLAKRVKTALQLHPAQTELMTWNSLLIAAQQNPGAAIAGLKQQKLTPKDRLAITTLIKRLEQTSRESGY